MLSNKKILGLLLLGLSLLVFSCSKKKSNSNKSYTIDYNNPEVVLKQAKKVLGNNVKFAYKGKFDRDSVIEIATGLEINTEKKWGIKFVLLKKYGNELKPVFETHLLKGSFRECLVKKINLTPVDYKMIYYNSQDYFLGSGGGEVYSYVVNYNGDKVYYAHLVSEPGKPVSLFLSGNIDIQAVKAFLLKNFNRDYPRIKLVSKDIVLNY